ncbi:MAG TPA: hypothetical protein VFH03_00135 [Actinoplanes sp.]|nr:hypothetical protein [Actinoplanes sp.]
MGVTMAVGMMAWMRFRRQGWATTLEMSGAMLAPAIAVVPLVALGVLTAGAAMALEHVVMFPLMLAVMLRRRADYLATGTPDTTSGGRSWCWRCSPAGTPGPPCPIWPDRCGREPGSGADIPRLNVGPGPARGAAEPLPACRSSVRRARAAGQRTGPPAVRICGIPHAPADKTGSSGQRRDGVVEYATAAPRR